MCKEELALCINNCKIYIWATRKVKHNTGLESTDQLNTDSETSDAELTIGAGVTLADYISDEYT